MSDDIQKHELTIINEKINEVATDMRFNDILLQIAEWSEAMRKIKFVAGDDAIYEQAKNYFQLAKIGLKQFEELRKNKVAVPTKIVNLINSMFRDSRQELEKIKKHFSVIVGTYEKEKEKERLEQTVKEKEESFLQVENFCQEIIPSTVTTEDGDTIRLREQIEVVVLNPELLLKAILSIQSKNSDITLDLIKFNMPELRKLAKERGKIPGCSIQKSVRAQ